MPRTPHSDAFVRVRDAILGLNDDNDRARLAALLGNMAEPTRPLGPQLRATLRTMASLSDEDLERLVGWFGAHMNRWGQTPRATGMQIDPRARRDPAKL